MSANPLQQLLGPVSERDFFEQYWQKRSLLVQDRGTEWPFTFDKEAFFAGLSETIHLKMAYQNEAGQHKECLIEADQARRIYEAGSTICATRMDYGCEALRCYVRRLEDFLEGAEFHMNAYLSPSGKGFGIHYDYHSVWILQIEGSKRWFYADEPAITYPVLNLVYPLNHAQFRFPWYTIQKPDESRLKETVLHPGDLLYLPAGAWHKTHANGYSLSITLGHEPVQAAKYISDLIIAGIWGDEGSRRHLPPILPAGGCEGASDEAVIQAFEDALATLRSRLDTVTADRLLQAWKMQTRLDRKKRRKEEDAKGVHVKDPQSAALLAAFRKQPARSKNGTTV